MITLVFLLCNPVVGCMSYSPDQVIPSEVVCHDVAAAILEEASQKVKSGEIPPHTALYKCINWGDPA